MQTDMGEGSYIPGPDENQLYTAEPLTLNDLKLLSDLFYLPYEHGPTARAMLQELDWLKNHSPAASTKTEEVAHAYVFEAQIMLWIDFRGSTLTLLFSRQWSGAPGRGSSMRCARRWCRCSTACQTPRTAAFCTTSTTTSATSRAGSAWLAPT